MSFALGRITAPCRDSALTTAVEIKPSQEQAGDLLTLRDLFERSEKISDEEEELAKFYGVNWVCLPPEFFHSRQLSSLDLSSFTGQALPDNISDYCFNTIIFKGLSFFFFLDFYKKITQISEGRIFIKEGLLKNSLRCLDLSYIEGLDNDGLEMINTFSFLEKIFIKGCHLTHFRLDLRLMRSSVRFIDVSNNDIKALYPKTYVQGTHAFFSPKLESSYPTERSQMFSLSKALEQDLIQESDKEGIYLGKPQEGQGLELHLDLRNNPLSDKTLDIFSLFDRAIISSDSAVACLPGNFFIYYSLPKPQPEELKG